MSPIFILIWAIFHGPVGIATGSQEFTSQEQCEKAAKALDTGLATVLTRCVRK